MPVLLQLDIHDWLIYRGGLPFNEEKEGGMGKSGGKRGSWKKALGGEK